MELDAVYLHIPFCVQKCHYCDFTSYPVKEYDFREYIRAIINEIEMYGKKIPAQSVRSIYIGGGTPSLVPARDLILLIDQVQRFFPVIGGGEITVECNPGTTNESFFQELFAGGVNRISLGAQAFQDRLLARLGRIHQVREIAEAVRDAQKSGFTNLSLDLMYGLPGQTMDEWRKSLQRAADLGALHISAYGLKIEQNTHWGTVYEKGQLELPSEDLTADMFEEAISYLKEQGYSHYEISNFARAGYESRHNGVYWENGCYLGLGAGASSHYDHVRWTNQRVVSEYYSAIRKGIFPILEEEKIDPELVMAETAFLGLRRMSGINLNEFQDRFGISFLEKYQRQIEKLNSLGLTEMSGGCYKLTAKGIFLANNVFLEFIP